MKNNILLIFFLFVSFQSYGQLFEASAIAGITGCQIDGDVQAGYNKPGIFAGIRLKAGEKEKLTWAIEFEYMNKGARKNVDTEKGDYLEFITRLHYVEIPVMLNYEALPDFHLHAGLYGSYLFHAYKEYEGLIIDKNDLNLHQYDFGINSGVSYKFADKMTVHARFEYSVTPISTISPYWRTNTISLALIYLLKSHVD